MDNSGNGASDLQERVLSSARAWIGTPYHPQASVRGVGCDCLGLVRGIWREVYGAEAEAAPGYSADWAEAGGEEQLLAAAARHLAPVAEVEVRGADVLVFRHRPGVPAKHCGILSDVTNGWRMIHALEGRGVVEAPVGMWWQRRIAGRYRFRAV